MLKLTCHMAILLTIRYIFKHHIYFWHRSKMVFTSVLCNRND